MSATSNSATMENLLFNSKLNAELSNFAYTSPIEFEGMQYVSVEAAYQAAKTTNPAERARLALPNRPSGYDARQIGKAVTLRPGWKGDLQLQVMMQLLRLKFAQPRFARVLADTGRRPLLHLSPWDLYWGVDNRQNGENHLGRQLETIRDEA